MRHDVAGPCSPNVQNVHVALLVWGSLYSLGACNILHDVDVSPYSLRARIVQVTLRAQ